MIHEVFEGLIPAPLQCFVGGASAAMGTAFTYIFGWSTALEALLWLMVIDYLTGIAAAYINPRKKLSSHIGMVGIVKKCMILSLVALAHMFDMSTGADMAQSIVVWFFFGNEGLSIIENAGKCGLPIPERLKDTLEQLTRKNDKGDGAR